MPLGPALPNGVRTPSTKTTSRALTGSLSLPHGCAPFRSADGALCAASARIRPPLMLLRPCYSLVTMVGYSIVTIGWQAGLPLASQRWVLGLAEEGQQLLQRPGVDHVVGGEPATLGGADAVGHVRQVPDR